MEQLNANKYTNKDKYNDQVLDFLENGYFNTGDENGIL